MADPNDAPRPDARDDLERVLAATTPSQRLAWLDEMLDLAHAAGALDKARRLDAEERRAKWSGGLSPRRTGKPAG